MSDSIMPEDSDVTCKRYEKVCNLSVIELLQLAWIFAMQGLFCFIEEFFYQFQWYRKRCGGKWSLKCHQRKVYWSPDNSIIDFPEIMARFGEIVDVIKTEDWGNG